jgi:hypothetical protein
MLSAAGRLRLSQAPTWSLASPGASFHATEETVVSRSIQRVLMHLPAGAAKIQSS